MLRINIDTVLRDVNEYENYYSNTFCIDTPVGPVAYFSRRDIASQKQEISDRNM